MHRSCIVTTGAHLVPHPLQDLTTFYSEQCPVLPGQVHHLPALSHVLALQLAHLCC